MAKSIQKLVDVTSFAKNEKGQMTFEYKNSSGQVKRTVLKVTFSETYRGKKRTFQLPKDATAEQMLAHAEALAASYDRQHVAGLAKASKMTEAGRQAAREQGLKNWENMSDEQKAKHAEAAEANAELLKAQWDNKSEAEKAAHAERSRAAALAQDQVEVSAETLAALASL